jgi:hypothetical protein
LQKCNFRNGNVHRIYIDIIPQIEYNVIIIFSGGNAAMRYLSTFEIAEKWGISPRRVGILCNENRIPGAQRAGSRWIIPEDAPKPTDARIKSGKYIKHHSREEGC